jgi:hypothetical protein
VIAPNPVEATGNQNNLPHDLLSFLIAVIGLCGPQ